MASFAGRYSGSFTDQFGNFLPSTAVTVYLRGTTTLASLFTSRTKTTVLANPTVTDANGNVTWFADPGDLYDVLVKGVTTPVEVPADPLEPPAPALPGASAATRYVGGTVSGAPVSGSFLVGDFVIDQTAKVWVCTVAGTPGTWVSASGTTATLPIAGTGAVAATNMVNAKVTGDANDRYVVTADGTIAWGSGAAARDAFLRRSAANTLEISSDGAGGQNARLAFGALHQISAANNEAHWGTINFGAFQLICGVGADSGGLNLRVDPGNDGFALASNTAPSHGVTMRTAGIVLARASTEKLGFYGAVPVVRPAGITAPAATAATNATPFGYSTQVQADAIVTAVRALISTIQTLGLTA